MFSVSLWQNVFFLTPGTKLGCYEILAPLGAGGMGEVYRARDAKLNREVAIKVLPAAFSQDSERLARFQREAQTLAALNHPNIAHIHGLEQASDSMAIVMELVEGPTLAERIVHGAMPVDEALPIARQIAEALEYAHEKGIVHRDLKPANIKVTDDGAVKVLDFGLAKALNGAVDDSLLDRADSPTLSVAATRAGMILGTAAYMSPEQAAMRPVDRRSDIWSFGVVLWEMLCGKRLFLAESASHTMADVLRANIDFSALPAGTPEPVRELLERCLERNVKLRLQAIGEARIAIEKFLDDPRPPAESAPVALAGEAALSRRNVIPWTLATTALLGALAIGFAYYRLSSKTSGQTSGGTSGAVRLSFQPPPNVLFDENRGDYIAVSPDGRKIAFTAQSSDGKRLLWVQTLDSSEAKPAPGSDEALEPFWSPDSRSLAFGSRGKLKRVDLAAGTVTTLCDATRLVGGSWSSQGVILFAPDYNKELLQVPATGGQRRKATAFDRKLGDAAHFHPTFLPDGRHFLFAVTGAPALRGIRSAVLNASGEATELKPLVTDSVVAEYASGHLLFFRNGELLAQELDAATMELKGDPREILKSDPSNEQGFGAPRFSASTNGVLVWKDHWRRTQQLTWFNRQGTPLGVAGPVDRGALESSPRLSPDGKRLAIRREGGIWVIDLARGIPQRLSPGQLPIWSADGNKLTFLRSGLVQMAANGSSEQETLVEQFAMPSDWSPDGRFLVYYGRSEQTQYDLFLYPAFGDRKARPLLSSPAAETSARFSPDGHWLAYSSDESGDDEIYVQPFTADGRLGADKKRLSANGGKGPSWRRDGKELFYLSRASDLMSVEIQVRGANLEAGVPKVLFKAHISGSYFAPYDVSADGQRFLFSALTTDSKEVAAPTVILNWTAELKKVGQ